MLFMNAVDTKQKQKREMKRLDKPLQNHLVSFAARKGMLVWLKKHKQTNATKPLQNHLVKLNLLKSNTVQFLNIRRNF